VIDVPHATLLVREAAKLHAASLLLAQRGPRPLNERFPLLIESWTLGKEHRTPFETVGVPFSSGIAWEHQMLVLSKS
jgi:hypothetical protein